jgi:hypothetical protein
MSALAIIGTLSSATNEQVRRDRFDRRHQMHIYQLLCAHFHFRFIVFQTRIADRLIHGTMH